MDATIEQIETDFWAHHYFENPNKDEVVDDEFDIDAVVKSMEENPDDWETV